MTVTDTTFGRIEGTRRNGVAQFLGIRFAEPPVGERRFAPPVRTGAWDGTYDATRYANRAVQNPQTELLGPPGPGENDEDCLFLNIFTPSADAARRPVLFWIHGGAYTIGSGNDYDGSVLAAQNDVVVVTVNYRLGALGFMDLSAHGEGMEGSASNGFRDQIAALEWTREAIADFGGDPDNVTIFGESAGGGSVLALLAAPSAEGLFHKAVAHSPGGVNTPPSQDYASAIADQLGGRGAVLDRLRDAPAERLVKAQEAVAFTGGEIDGTVVTRHPTVAVSEAGASGVPLVIGSNRDEGTLFSAIFDPAPGLFAAMTPAIATQVTRGEDPASYLAELREAYPDDDDRARGERVWVDLFRRTSVETAAAATAAGPGGWLYRFDLPSTAFEGKLGATHASEIPFTFNWFAAEEVAGLSFHDRGDDVVRDLAQRWSATVATFARTGDPNGAGLPEWPPYDEDQRRCLILDVESRIDADPDEAHRHLWTNPVVSHT